MGKIKYLREVEDLLIKTPVVRFSSIERIVNKKNNIKQYAKQLVRNLIKKGKIKKLVKGFYTYYDDPSLTVFCFKPAYLGLQDALSFHDLWEQETIPIIITSNNVRPGNRKVLETNIQIRRVNKKYLFGFDYFKEGDFYFPYSDIEKTLIDMVYFKERLSSEAIRNFKNKINLKKLKKYLKIYPERIKKRILKLLESG